MQIIFAITETYFPGMCSGVELLYEMEVQERTSIAYTGSAEIDSF